MISYLQYAGIYVVALVTFLAIDLVWVGFVAKSFYQNQIGHLFADSVFVPAAAALYAFLILGLMVFAIVPALQEHSLFRAVLLSGFFGFCTYMTYDLTNWATLRNWTLTMTLVDICWGTCVPALVGLSTYIVSGAYIIR